MTKTISKPVEGDYAPYTIAYIGLVPDDGRVLTHLEDNLQTMFDQVRSIPEDKLAWRFAEGEWTIKEILLHVMDSERIFSYRALRIARGDTTALPGFEQTIMCHILAPTNAAWMIFWMNTQPFAAPR